MTKGSPRSLAERAFAAVLSEADPGAAVRRVLDLFAAETGCRWLGVVTPEDDGQPGLRLVAARGNAAGEVPGRLREERRGEDRPRELEKLLPMAGSVIASGRPLFRAAPTGDDPAASIIPIVQGGTALGALCLLGEPAATAPGPGERALNEATRVLALPLRNLALAGELERQELFGRCSEELVARIASGAPEPEIQGFLARFLGEAFGADAAAIGLLSDDREWLLIEAIHESRLGRGSDPITIRLSDDPVIAATARGGGMVELNDLCDARLPQTWRALAAERGVASLISVSLADSSGVWGLALLANEAAGAVLKGRDRELFRVIVRHAAPLLQNSRMLRVLRHSVDGFKLLFETSREVSSVLNLAEVPRIMAQRAMDLSQSDECLVFLLEPDRTTLRPVLALSEYAAEMMKLEVTIGEGITGHVARSRVGEYVNRVDLDPRSRHVPGTPVTPEAMLTVPLLCADKLIGVMVLYKLDGRHYNDLDLATITIFATQAAIAIENARLFESVAAERTRLSTMIQQMEEAVFFCDGEGTILVVNSAAQALTGRSDPLEGRPFIESFRAGMKETLEAVLAELQTGSSRNITRELRAAGRYILGSFTGIRNGQDGLSGFVVLCKDITDMKTMESQLLQSSKMSAVGQLATGVAHEFNNLIAAIYGYAQFMKDNRDERILTKGIDIILNSSERARDLTRSLLTFSRNSEGRFEALGLDEVIDDALLLVEQQLTKEGIRVVRHYDRLPHAWADRSRLQEVFLNLISNARDAMPQGGTLTVTTRLDEGRLVAEVGDTGVGIPSENLGRIFEPFFTTKGALGGARTPGTGLGLFTVYNTVTAHGGKVDVTSSPGAGTRIRLFFPIQATQPAQPAPLGPARHDEDGLRRAG